MRVASLHIYPVKSTAPTDLEQATVEPWGLAGDRRWLVVDDDGNQLTAREHRPLLQVRADAGPEAHLSLAGPHDAPLEVGPDDFRTQVPAAVWNTSFTATDAGPAAAHWFTALLQTPARLVYLHDPTARPNTDERARPGDTVSAADSYPLLLTTTASLDQLNSWIDSAGGSGSGVPMTRFRPNVVVESGEPWIEDDWSEIRIGAVTFRSGGPCQRCVMTTIDPATLVSTKEPIRTMAGRRRWDGKTWFGLNLAPIDTGSICVGDPVSVIG